MIRDLAVAFGTIFIAELPDKTMVATLMLATAMPRRLAVWLGVSAGYLVHVAVAVAAGSLLARLPDEPVRAVVAVLFVVGGVATWRASTADEEDGDGSRTAGSWLRTFLVAASVILVAEFADFTQLATAGLAASSGSAGAVLVGAFLALSSVAGLAVLAGDRIVRVVPLATVRRAAAVVFLAIGALAALSLAAG
ncbi:MAG: TMEM165/GDT1 family protein [Acidobacteria bacterium]|nr:TMEM165/GDT1 family protein [Acidobacteriota bacterium]